MTGRLVDRRRFGDRGSQNDPCGFGRFTSAGAQTSSFVVPIILEVVELSGPSCFKDFLPVNLECGV